MKIYHRTGNYLSFIRQLNIYGFKKLKSDGKDKYNNPFFRRDKADYLCLIKRKSSKRNRDKINFEENSNSDQDSAYFDNDLHNYQENIKELKDRIGKLKESNANLENLFGSHLNNKEETLNRLSHILKKVVRRENSHSTLNSSELDYINSLSKGNSGCEKNKISFVFNKLSEKEDFGKEGDRECGFEIGENGREGGVVVNVKDEEEAGGSIKESIADNFYEDQSN